MDHLMEMKSIVDDGAATTTPPARGHDPIATPSDRSSETTAAGIPWLAFARHRAAIRERWPIHWNLRVETDHFATLDGIKDSFRADEVLDVGATDRRHRPAVEQRWPEVAYRSLDLDRTLPHDYHDFAEVDRKFDLVMCLEVLEHVAEDVAVQILRECVAALRPGGYLLLSVPNRLVPYYQLEFTHRTAYTYQDLGGLCRINGLDVVDMTRSTQGSNRHQWIHRHLLARWHRLMYTDFCGSITCLARRPKIGSDEGDPGHGS